jgi:hypothetical protein
MVESQVVVETQPAPFVTQPVNHFAQLALVLSVVAAPEHVLAVQFAPLTHVQFPSDPILEAQLLVSPVYVEHDPTFFTQPAPVDLQPS